jgi:sugar/nucleoside kinase (ribokinase family)
MSNEHAIEAPAGGAIIVVSTLATDWIVDDSGGPPRPVPGGPGHYIPRALQLLGAPCNLITGSAVNVEVRHGDDGEVYRLEAIPRIPLPPSLVAPAVIVSPIVQEIDPDAFPDVTGLLALDIQGLVRRPEVWTDATEGPFHLAPLLRRAALVKGSVDEVALLDDESRDALACTTLLLTGGHRGARIIAPEGETRVDANRVETENTIGAGDSFLAALVWALVCGRPMTTAAAEAARFTEQMLRTRATNELESS